MPVFTFIASWVIVWWLVFFAALPFGVKTPRHPQAGNDPGAPDRPQLLKKSLASLAISGVIMVIIVILIKLGWLDFYSYFSGNKAGGGVDGLR